MLGFVAPRLALATFAPLAVLAVAGAAGSARSEPARVSGPSGLIAVTVTRCEQLVAIPSTGASKRNVSRNLACNARPVWSREGEIAFLKREDPSAGIAIMRPDGSGQRTVIPGPVWHPRWAPFGRRLLYVDATSAVHVVDLNAGTDRKLARAQSAEWSPDETEIAGVWTLQLTIQRADGSGERTLATTKPPVRILGWSVAGVIAFAATDGFIWTIRPDGSDEWRLTPGFSGAWSPDGTRLAIYRGVNWPAPIVVLRADGSELAVIAQNGESIPGWSPDGTRLAFRVDRRLLIADASGGGRRIGPMIGRGDPEEMPAWSPDGSTIVTVGVRDDEDVIGLDARTGAVKPMLGAATAREVWPSFSPDGERVLFSNGFDAGRLYTARPDGRGRRELGAGNALLGGAWSPDGSRIAYVSPVHKLRITRARVGAGIGKVIAGQVAYGSVSWSPDGRRLVFANATGRALYTVRAVDGGDQRRILRALPRTRVDWPRWSPRGDRIAFSEFENCQDDECYGPGWITTVSPTGHGKDRLTMGGFAGWSPDGRFLAYTRGEVTLFDVARRTSIALSGTASESPPDWQPTCTRRGTRRADLLRGTARADLLCGLQGNDQILGGQGRDRLFGEQGNDRILARDGSFDVVGCGPGQDSVVADRRDLVGLDCERVRRR